MATYLLTWNPKNYPWYDLHDCISRIKRNKACRYSWSCGSNKRIRKGDRLFLIRLGKEPRGIMASGWATSGVYPDIHWDEAKAIEGKRALYIKVRFDAILNPEKHIFPLSRLREGIYRRMHWTPQSSGVTISDEVAEQLEKDWSRFLSAIGLETKAISFPEEAEVGETFIEGAKKRIVVNAYERDSRAREACIRHYGLSCAVCGFNFEEAFGRIGKGYIHVHHIKPLSEIGGEYELDPIEDLRPICPNCHAMIHQRKPAYSIEELREILKRRR